MTAKTTTTLMIAASPPLPTANAPVSSPAAPASSEFTGAPSGIGLPLSSDSMPGAGPFGLSGPAGEGEGVATTKVEEGRGGGGGRGVGDGVGSLSLGLLLFGLFCCAAAERASARRRSGDVSLILGGCSARTGPR